MRKLISCLILSGVLILPLSAIGNGAASAENSDNGESSSDGGNAALNIQLEIEPGCTINFDNGAQIVFPSFSFLPASVSRESSFTFSCTEGYNKAVDVSLSGGAVNPNDKPSSRKLYLDGSMQSGKTLSFQIYAGNTASNIWGDGSDSAEPYHIPADNNSAKRNIPFTAVLEKQDISDLPMGEYSNTLTAVIDYGK